MGAGGAIGLVAYTGLWLTALLILLLVDFTRFDGRPPSFPTTEAVLWLFALVGINPPALALMLRMSKREAKACERPWRYEVLGHPSASRNGPRYLLAEMTDRTLRPHGHWDECTDLDCKQCKNGSGQMA